jgi:hypothetical protein
MRMRSWFCLLVVSALAAVFAAPAQAAFSLKDLDVTFTEAGGGEAMDAGSHPFAFTTTVNFATTDGGVLPFEVPDGSPRDLTIGAIPGLVGSPTATPRCTALEFVQMASPSAEEKCPEASQVGVTDVTYSQPDVTERFVVYNLVPPLGVAAKLGFVVPPVPITIEAGVNPDPPYNIVARLANIPQALPVYGSVTTIWGFPADSAHNADRPGCVGDCSADLGKVPFLTVPRACEGPLPTFFSARSWENPETVFPPPPFTHDSSEPPQPRGFEECSKLGFGPRITAQPTSKTASSPTGIDIELLVDDEGVDNPTGLADSDIKKAVVTLPEGMTANPSLAEGLSTCSPADYAAEAVDSEPGEGCPEASKIGTVEAETPLLEDEILHGQLFIASQNDNPFNSLLALYMVIKNRDLGVLVKLAGRIEPDPETGQLTTTFGEPGHELPQFPVSRVRVHLREGGRSPLIAPPLCGEYETVALFTPWANPAVPLETTASFEITNGPGGGACPPGGTPPFAPGFEAGTINNAAAGYSPFHMRLTRRDGDQDLTRFSAKLPPGLTAKLAGVSQCPDAAIEAARTKSGRQELASPSCPANSKIGTALGGAGAGGQLTYVPGSIYLAGPYKGAPLSVAAIVPAVAGPFDVGIVVTRFALRVNSKTAEVEVDGAASDPIPHILAGIPLAVRDVRADVNRSQFSLNPTNCDPFAVGVSIWGGGADPFSVADDSPVARAVRFLAADCAALGFKPKLSLRLKGGTRRGGHPALRAVVTPRSGDANFADAVVTLPRSAFLDQGHIRTICTRVQFAAKACPAAAIYGHARAFTPILDEPAEGPVYLRSSDHNLPDLVIALKGPKSAPVDVEVVGRIDSHKGGIRSSFESIPDLPVSKFILTMQGGKKGLIVNSRNLCARTSRATVRFSGQNGRRHNFSPRVKPAGCKGKKAKRASRRR